VNEAPAADVRALLASEGSRGWVRLTERYGLTFRLSGRAYTCDPALVAPLLTDPAHTRVRSRAHKSISAVTPGSRGLLFYDGDQWRRHARAVSPTFTRGHLDRFGRLVHDTSNRHVDRWLAGEGIEDLSRAVMELGAELVLPIGYGVDSDQPLARGLARQLMDYKQRTMQPNPRARLDQLGVTWTKALDLPWGLSLWAELAARTRRLRGTVRALLAGGCPLRRPGWIAGLAGEGTPLAEMSDALNHLYGAYNALDFVVTAALVELSRHPEWRDRLREEAIAVLGDRAYPDREDVARMTVLANVQKEVLRRYPVAMGVFRRLGAPLDVGGERLPAGAEVAILPYALHHHPAFWSDPERFDPTRWDASAEPRVPFSYIPFLVGPRKCLGQPLAEYLFSLVVTCLLRRIDLDLLVERADLNTFLIPRFTADLPFRARAITRGSS
jgi:cytochrome P450